MRSENAIREASASLSWLLERADIDPDSLAAEHLLAALDWVLGDDKENPLPDLLREIDGMRFPPKEHPNTKRARLKRMGIS